MPSADVNDLPRFVVDESSFDFRGMPDDQVEKHLDNLNDVLGVLHREHPGSVARSPLWDQVECRDGCELYRFLCREIPSGVDRDTLLLANRLLDRCVEWDERAVGHVDTSVVIDDAEPRLALSVAYALALVRSERGAACLVFGSGPDGFRTVQGEVGQARLFFFRDMTRLPEFWRSLFGLENVPEHGFFELSRLAFPSLVFAPGLSFGRFVGTYLGIRDHVVVILAGLNDHFGEEHARCVGPPREIEVRMGQHHLNVSLESPKTRASQQLMRQRDVTHDGRIVRCEWHAKIEPHRNRIHFSTPRPELDGRIVVGIFVDHLDT